MSIGEFKALFDDHGPYWRIHRDGGSPTCIVMAYVVMACIVMAYIAYMLMARTGASIGAIRLVRGHVRPCRRV